MRKTIHPHYGMYLKLDGLRVLSFSPERFFRTSDRQIESFPMKGTRPRSADIVIDERLAGELYCSEKDRAEHLMIVDLIRNDIGKVCEYGSVNVEDLYGIHSFETVHQMVSRVYGKMQQYYLPHSTPLLMTCISIFILKIEVIFLLIVLLPII